MRRREDKIDIDFGAIEGMDTQIDALLDKNERIELYAKYLPNKPAENNGLSRVCKDIIENRLIGTKRLHMWLKNKNPVNAQIIIRELFHIFSWRLIKHHRTKDIYHYIRITNKLISEAISLGFSELVKYMKSWQQKILKDNLKEIIRIRHEFIQKSKNQKSEIMDTPIDTPEKQKDKNQIIDQIINLLSQLKD